MRACTPWRARRTKRPTEFTIAVRCTKPLLTHLSTLCDVSPRLGIGYCSGHFGELLQGAFTEPAGSIVRGLVTLPYPPAGVMAHVTAVPGSGEIQAPFGKSKTADLVRGYLSSFTVSQVVVDCAVQLSSRLVEGVGMGSSTADLVATVRALDLALSLRTDDATVARPGRENRGRVRLHHVRHSRASLRPARRTGARGLRAAAAAHGIGRIQSRTR